MRLVRWVIGAVVAVGLLVLVGAAFVGGSGSCPTVSVTGPIVSFIGTAQAERGGDVTFDVEQWAGDRLPPGSPQELEPGDQIVVTYSGGDQRFIHVGQRYQVDAWGSAPDGFASGVQTADECPIGGSATFHADGSAIDTTLFSADGIEPYTGRIALVALMATAATGAIVAYRRVRHPRLTIDGQPRR